MKIRTYKIKNQDLEVLDTFEANCWYNAQKVFTDKMRKTEGYIYMVDREDVEHFGWTWEGPGHYGEGDTLLNDKIVSTFNNGKETLTINAR